MSKQVHWSKAIVERFVEQACLTKDEEAVLRTRVVGWTITEQSQKLGLSERTVNRIVHRLKVKYDNVQRYDPMLPPRKNSAAETYMDSH